MDSIEFQQSNEIVSKFIIDYINSLTKRNVAINVNPGFLENQVEAECPSEGSEFTSIFRDFEAKIMPGVANWASPHFHGLIPACNTYSAMIAEFLIAGMNIVCLNWEACPAATELEVIVLNWLAKMLDLPKTFIRDPGNPLCGVLQNSSTEATMLSLLSARSRSMEEFRSRNSEEALTNYEIINKLVVYSSTLANQSAKRACLVTSMKLRQLTVNHEGRVSANTLRDAFEADVANGFIPCLLVSTMGTEALCSFDDLELLGPICKEYNVWLHIDAGYAGSALACPELRYMSKGMEYADSFAVDLDKWLLMSFDVVAYWTKRGCLLRAASDVDPLYLQHKHVDDFPDYMNWQLGTGRRFKALKVWIVLKCFGTNGVRESIKRHISLARQMKQRIMEDCRFTVVACHMGTVCFSLKTGNDRTLRLLDEINRNGKLFVSAWEFEGIFFIRFMINQKTRTEDIDFAWAEILSQV